MSKIDDVTKLMTTEEVMAQMELIRGEGRSLLTDDERSSWHNISLDSDNGYLYQDADFLCGAIIKERKSLAVCRALLEKWEWHGVGAEGRYCPECYGFKKRGHKPDCAIAAELAGTVGGK